MGLNRKGFTLIELLIYTGLLSITSVVIVTAFLGFTKSQGGITARTEVNSSLRFAVEKINQDIRSSTSITTPATAGSSSSNLVMVVGTNTVTYCISSNKLRRQLDGTCGDASSIVTTDKVNTTSITFTRLGNTNTSSNTTVVTIQTSINMTYASTNPDLNYSANQVTVQSPL